MINGDSATCSFGHTVIHCLKPFRQSGDFEGLFFSGLHDYHDKFHFWFGSLGVEILSSKEIQSFERLSQNTANSRLRISHARIVKYLIKLHSHDIQFAFGKLKKYNHHEKARCGGVVICIIVAW